MQDVEDEPLFAERVAGIDIAKAGVEVTIRVPSDSRAGGRQQETRSFGTTRRELMALADWLRSWGVTKAGMEATPVIWGSNKFLLCFGSSDRRVRVRDGRPDGHLIARGPGRVLPRAAAAGGGSRRVPVRGPGAGRWFPRGGGV